MYTMLKKGAIHGYTLTILGIIMDDPEKYWEKTPVLNQELLFR